MTAGMYAGCASCGAGMGEKHRATVKTPTLAVLEHEVERGERYRCTDGCRIWEMDGRCVHGHQTWLHRLGWV